MNNRRRWGLRFVVAACSTTLMCVIGITQFKQQGDTMTWGGADITKNTALSILLGMGVLAFLAVGFAIAAMWTAFAEMRAVLQNLTAEKTIQKRLANRSKNPSPKQDRRNNRRQR